MFDFFDPDSFDGYLDRGGLTDYEVKTLAQETYLIEGSIEDTMRSLRNSEQYSNSDLRRMRQYLESSEDTLRRIFRAVNG